MRAFTYARPGSPESASQSLQGLLADARSDKDLQGRPPAEFLAGGTTLIDLMKLEVMQPRHLVDLSGLRRDLGAIVVGRDALKLGALASMAEVADHPDIAKNYPVLAQSLMLAASAQLRNMATLGGNVLQRTRCTYFRDLSWAACNKRDPGSGCAALDGINRTHAVLGTSDDCIATYPGDFAQALIALDATVDIVGRGGARTIGFTELHRAPGRTPILETSLAPGEIITGFTVPAAPWLRRSLYLKIRDRQSYEFALASAAVALDMAGGVVREARIALGGVATIPWRARESEALLVAKPLDEALAKSAARAAFADAKARDHNLYKIALGQETLVRALLQAAAMEV